MQTPFLFMRKHPYLIVASLLLLAALGGAMVIESNSGGSADALSPSSYQPNFLVIRTDDQDFGSMSVVAPSGTEVMQNVNDFFAANGVNFTNSYVSFSLCCPSRASTFTGQYAHNHGILSNNLPTGGYEKFASTTETLPVWLNNAGYTTYHVGKYLNGYDANSTPPYAAIPPGWDKWFTVVAAASPDYYNYKVVEDGPILHSFGGGAANYQTDVFTNKVLSYLDQTAVSSEPFFMMVDYTAPHKGGFSNKVNPAARHIGLMNGASAPRPPSFNEADVSDKPKDIQANPPMSSSGIAIMDKAFRDRAEALMSVDEGFSRMIQKLKDTGQYNRTIIIFTSDNGWMFGQHRLPGSKFVSYEESIRVPLLMSGPGIPKGKSLDMLVNNVDLPATLLHWARAPAATVQEGRSLVPILRNPNAAWRTDFLIENPLLNFYTGLRTQDPATGEEYKYVEYDYDLDGNWDERELYALTPDTCMPNGDPYEEVSQHNNPCYATLLQNLHARLSVLKSCVGILCK
jgi:arylsulfatase A-like enzyme